MNGHGRVVQNRHAVARKLVDDPSHQLFVAGDGTGREDDQILRAELDLRMVGKGHAVECGHRLALAAGGNQRQLFGAVFFYVVDVNERFFGQLHVPKLGGGPQHADHAAAGHGDLAAVLGADVDDLLHTVHVGGKGGDNHALIDVVAENPLQGAAHLLFRHGKAGAFRVGGFAQ